jgi:hypothetical protein
MNFLKNIQAILFLLATTAGAVEVPRQPPASLTSSGIQSPNQSNINGSNQATYNIFKGPINIGESPRPRKNSFEDKREALFMFEHPTALQVTNLYWTSWFNDPAPFLDVELTNTSSLPALDVEVSLLDTKTGATLKKLKPYKLSESYTMKILKGSPIVVGPNAKWQWPLVSQPEAESIVGTKCITGAGLGFEPMRTDWTNASGGTYKAGSSAILMRIKYKTIFGQQHEFVVTGVIDTSSRDSTYMIRRGTTKEVPLRCVGDPNWNSVTKINGQVVE